MTMPYDEDSSSQSCVAWRGVCSAPDDAGVAAAGEMHCGKKTMSFSPWNGAVFDGATANAFDADYWSCRGEWDGEPCLWNQGWMNCCYEKSNVVRHPRGGGSIVRRATDWGSRTPDAVISTVHVREAPYNKFTRTMSHTKLELAL